MHCTEAVAWHGRFRAADDRLYRVDACEGHAEGLGAPLVDLRPQGEHHHGAGQQGGDHAQEGEAQVRRMVESLSGMAAAIAELTDEERAQVYAELGVTITYHPDGHLVIAEARPSACATGCVGGGT